MKNPVSRFAYSQADVSLKRSQFGRPQRHLTTMSAGLLYPLLVDEVLPGDTYTIDMASLIRMSTPIHPVMDNAYFDAYFFFVPNRIVWEHWKEFMGESPSEPYINPVEYSVPGIVRPQGYPDLDLSGPIPHKSILDYMGVPAGYEPSYINALPVRGFCTIWNEWFRDQNLQNAIDVRTDDADVDMFFYGSDVLSYDTFDEYITSAARGGHLPPVNKYHDYFTSALKEPQKGEPVPIPLSGFAPVYASNMVDTSSKTGTTVNFIGSGGVKLTGLLALDEGVLTCTEDGSRGDSYTFPANLGADLRDVTGTYATISDLRYAFQLQKFLEADNRGGTRYREILKQHFNVTSPDASQQVPEFLGGKRIPINIAQVLQTSATNEVSPQGNTAAYSLTSDKFSAFTKSFTEHGFIFCVGCIRTQHTYQQGIEKFWSRSNKFDYYFPEFANISEQPIYNPEIFAFTRDIDSEEMPADRPERYEDGIFGYQEAWADYRYKPNRVSGEFRSNYPGSLDIWHYADDYVLPPKLSGEWMAETRSNIDRTLAVDSDVADQFICDFYFDMKTTRCMPVNSIPGLADHH